MSRVAKQPIALAKGVEINVQPEAVAVKGPKGSLSLAKPVGIDLRIEDGHAHVSCEDAALEPLAGTVRSIVANMVHGVSTGFERKLDLVGVGYRATMQGKDISLALGYSHPVVFAPPAGITISTPTQTEILVSGADKQLVGEVAAKIRSYRPPEPYKGKGVKYSDEIILRKEAKKA